MWPQHVVISAVLDSGSCVICTSSAYTINGSRGPVCPTPKYSLIKPVYLKIPHLCCSRDVKTQKADSELGAVRFYYVFLFCIMSKQQQHKIK